MNIVMIARLFWPHGGGVETHVYKLSQKLIADGHSVTVVTEQFGEKLPLEETYDGITIARLPFSFLRDKLATWQWMWQQRRLFLEAEVVHVHDVFWWYLPLRLFFWKQPVHTTFHGYEGVEPPKWKAVVHRKVVEWLSRKTICVGDFMRKWYTAKPDAVTYGAADWLELVNPEKEGKPKTAVYFGRLAADAGVMSYVRAMERLGSEWKLDVYGDGPQRHEIEHYMRAHTVNVQISPWNDQMSIIIGNYRYAFVSRYLAMIEAMQAKRLVVAVYNNEIKRDYLFCHPMRKNMIIAGKPQELVEKLNELTERDEQQMVHNAYVWAKEQTWDTMKETYVSLWNE